MQLPASAVGVLAPAAFLAWTVPRTWFTGGGGRALGLPIPEFSLNAWGGVTAVAGGFAAAAIVWGSVRLALSSRVPRGLDLLGPVLASAALAATLAGILLPRGTGTGDAAPAWGLAVGAAIGVAWSVMEWRAFRERRHRPRSAVGFGDPAGSSASEGGRGAA